jgi:hypothetical protein
MKRAWERRLAALDARHGDGLSCKSPVDCLFYQAGCLFSASQPLFFRRSVA